MPSIKTLISVATLAAAMVGCGEPHRAAAQRYLALAEGVLVANGICSSAADCQKKELLF
ncbi:MAG: hypothetical protein LBI59_05625 [Candidatus Accumulibacter sp.]|jgi:hypothetical protein|nr:hypothetical protein [Accumulibacter sp.]